MRARRVLLPALPLAPLFALTAGCGGCNRGGGIEVNAQGATFVEPIMVVWAEEYRATTDGKVKINYQGTGSGAGVRALVNKEAAFGCSDAPMSARQLEEAKAAGGEVIHVPTVIGAVVPMYNLPGVKHPVNFTGPVLARIFTGKIKTWNDPDIRELNPGVDLPALDIQPVYRSDSSGTSFIFTDYLAGVDPGFKSTVGAAKEPSWPQGVGISKPKSAGVADHVRSTPGAIGYIELTYALDTNAPYGSVKNKAGNFILADFDSISAAAEAALGEKQTREPYSLHDLAYNLTDAAGEKSYPIAAMSFAILYKKQDDAATGKAVVEFLKWATSADGQAMAKARKFAPLPEGLRKKIHDTLDTVEMP